MIHRLKSEGYRLEEMVVQFLIFPYEYNDG
jgi:hypothetical protein